MAQIYGCPPVIPGKRGRKRTPHGRARKITPRQALSWLRASGVRTLGYSTAQQEQGFGVDLPLGWEILRILWIEELQRFNSTSWAGKELGVPSLEKRKLWAEFIVA